MNAKGIFWVWAVLLFLVTWLVRHHPFFWDTIQLASKHGHFFYETDFQSLILPPEIDSGHPPLFGMYLAVLWKIFGKTLTISHFAMLPFLWGCVFLLVKSGEKLAGTKGAFWLPLICFADPVLASQSILVSPDIPLLFFMLLGLWGIYRKDAPVLLTISVLGLGLISMRGMMVAVGLFAFSLVVCDKKITPAALLIKLLPFIPGGVIAGVFLFYHYLETGWIGYHAGSPWAPSYERVGLGGFLKNVLILGWRLADFGRLFMWLALGWMVFRGIQRHWKISKTARQLGWLTTILFLVLIPSQLLHVGLLAHRYLLPIFVSLAMLTFHLANETLDKRLINRVLGVVVAGLLTGNLWIYPRGIAMGWDSTLAHVPWYEISLRMKKHIHALKIPMETVGTAFPNIGSREIIELNGNSEGFSEKDFSKNCYILYSNVMNDFTNPEIETLERNWLEIKRLEYGGIYVILFGQPNPLPQCKN
jgi:hypothetical protein